MKFYFVSLLVFVIHDARGQSNPDNCNLPQLIGSGKYRIPRFYYNPASRRCEVFYYSGCCGNENNYPNQRDCQVLCEVDPCTQNVDPGQGNNQITRYYYDRNLRLCQAFQYTGTGGNRNNFPSIQDCRSTCEENPNPCASGTPASNPAGSGSQQCSRFTLDSCPANYYCHVGEYDPTTLCCPTQGRNRCSLTISEGLGNAQLRRYYFDMTSCSCRQFTYKGLKGNENNFLTQQACESTCSVLCNVCTAGTPALSGDGRPQQCSGFNGLCPAGFWCHVGETVATTLCCPGVGNGCQQSRQVGEGTAQLTRYYFSQTSAQCEQFTYSGRKGNQNNFPSLTQCVNTCNPFRDPCSSGPAARDNTGRIRYCSRDNPLNSCPQGNWCHVGVDNTTTLCCTGARDPCNMRQSQGSGTAVTTRYFYDYTLQSCRTFTYTGVQGNQNNFLTMEACQSACRAFENPCQGQPARDRNGQPIFCSRLNKDICPVTYYCHLGGRPETTLCCPGPTNQCSVPLAPGGGSENLPRWYYNSKSKRCDSFTYFGKGGNQNNFVLRTECEDVCPD